MKAYRQYQQAAMQDCCRYVGIHIEGPYIAPAAKGAHPLETLLTPREHGYGWILENRDIIREVTVAPELPGMQEMIARLTDAGILISGGHDAAEPEDIVAAVEAGMRHCTHIYCAMSTLHKTDGQRRHGLCEYAMTHDELTAEMIADNHHVPPLLAKMIHKAKGADRVCLVSDAIGPAGLPESEQLYRLGTGEDCTMVRVEDGVAMVEDRSCYAGSVQALDQMVRNMVLDSEIPLADAVRMASLTPAQVIGIADQCGSIEQGKRADLCVLDSGLHVLKTVIAGRVVWEGE
jgi:N-acetylglucosamine-6-phosphate deacetylase